MVKQGIDIKLLTSILEDFRLNDAQSEELQKVIYAIEDGRLVKASDIMPQKAKKSESGHYYICPQCQRFVEKYEQPHGRIEIKHCMWCGYKLDFEEDIAEKTKGEDEWKAKGLEYLDLSTRAYNALCRHLCRIFDKRLTDVTIGDLTTLTLTELCGIWGMGRKGAENVVLKLREIGLSLLEE